MKKFISICLFGFMLSGCLSSFTIHNRTLPDGTVDCEASLSTIFKAYEGIGGEVCGAKGKAKQSSNDPETIKAILTILGR